MAIANALATRALLEHFVALLQEFGPDSPQARDYIRQNSADAEFVRLADLSRKLKKAATWPVGEIVNSGGDR